MRCLARIVATFVLSVPPALVGCLAPPGDTIAEEQVEPAGEAVSADGCAPAAPLAPPSYQPPSYSAPVYPAPSYPAPTYGAPRYAPPVYEAPSYEAPSYQAPSPPPAVAAPVYSAPSYAAPIYLPPITIGPFYLQIGAPAAIAPMAPSGGAGS